ncbi:MAG: DUF4363 family protein [Ruminiclostridium sp.]|nr:DUF4363 family protein [Ruminiclostridium sp.]
MKRLIVCLFILAGMTALGITSAVLSDNEAAAISDGLVTLEAAAMRGDTAYLAENAKKLSERWESFRRGSIFITDLESAFEITQALIHAVSLSESSPEDAAKECRDAVQLIEAHRAGRRFSLDNIF